MNPDTPGEIVDTILPNDIRRFLQHQLGHCKKIASIINSKMQIVAGTLYYFDAIIYNKKKCRFNIYKVTILSQQFKSPRYVIQEMHKIGKFN